jgi:hypothetical protein
MKKKKKRPHGHEEQALLMVQRLTCHNVREQLMHCV